QHSPFAEKLNTNYVPSDEEFDEIRALLVEPLGQLARLDTQIDETQAFLDQLRVKRQSLKDESDSYSVLKSLVRHLPQDILQEIFHSCLPTQKNAAERRRCFWVSYADIYWRSVGHSIPLL
ncbi:hypothetical protein DFH09DRAFT_911321, partial [Mycena vulgaris]